MLQRLVCFTGEIARGQCAIGWFGEAGLHE